MRTTIAAALLATALAEQTFTDVLNGVHDTLPWPDLTVPLTFVQTAGQENFNIMLDGQTHGDPEPPELGKTDVFTVAGIATHPLEIANLEFICYLFGAKVYDELQAPDQTTAMPGTVWNGQASFDVPTVAPSTQYDIQINGLDAAGNILFTAITDFTF